MGTRLPPAGDLIREKSFADAGNTTQGIISCIWQGAEGFHHESAERNK